MKIGLLTYHDAYNYGAACQTVASVHILGGFGRPVVINYINPNISNQLSYFRFSFDVRGILRLVKDLVRQNSRRRAINRFKCFIESHCIMTEPALDRRGLKEVCADIDVFVAGSDQIWNPACQNKKSQIDGVYFLDFSSKKKVSYASSFGAYEFSDQENSVLAKYLDDFSHLSVREKDASEKIQKSFNKEVMVCVDPTLLLTHCEWLEYSETVEGLPEKYLLVYAFDKTSELIRVVKHVAEKTGLEVVVVDQNVLPGLKCALHCNNVGPAEFVYLFSNATYVVTDSFHGTAFSVNFEKPFVSVAPKGKVNRLVSFLTKVGAENRLLENGRDISSVELYPNFGPIRARLEKERQKSLLFLRSSFVK